MPTLPKNRFSLIETYRSLTKTLRNEPRILLPFAIFALVDLLILLIIYLSPREPFVKLFGPPVRTFWGERFLHYPQNFILMPQLAMLFRMFSTVIVGALTTAMAIAMLYNKSYKPAYKKYPSTFLVMFTVTGIFYCSLKLFGFLLSKYFGHGYAKLLFIGPRWWFGPIMSIASFVAILIIQSLLIYAIPALISGKKRFFSAIWESLLFFKGRALTTLLLVGLPMLIYVPFIVLNGQTNFLVNEFFPEIILWLGVAGIIVNSMVIDPLITISAAMLYLHNKNKNH